MGLLCNSPVGFSSETTDHSCSDNRITYLNGDCLLYNIDLQRAFRHLKLDLRDIDKTGLQFEGHYNVDTAVPFGYKHGSVCMQRVTDRLRSIMHNKGYFLTNYIDDLIGCDNPETAIKAFQFLKNLTQEGPTIS